MIKTLAFILIFSSIAYASDKELSQEKDKLIQQNQSQLTQKEENDLRVRGWRDRRFDEFKPPVSKTSRPSDYVNDIHRGTVEFNPKWKNYSYHTIEIPDGSTVIEMNFSQISPATKAIVVKPGFGHNLTFIGCNLTNVFIESDWTIKSSNTTQMDNIGSIDEDGQVMIIDNIYISDHPSKVKKQRINPSEVLE